MRHALESLFRRRFYVVHLVLLAVCAILLAKTATAVAGGIVLEKLQGAMGKSAEKRPLAQKPVALRDFGAASDANIFEGKREAVAESAGTMDAPPPMDGDGCEGVPKSSLRLRLVGTVVFDVAEWSVASIVDEGKSGSGARMYSINECVNYNADPNDPDDKLLPKPPPCNRVADSALVRSIMPERVCLWNESEHHIEYIAIAEPPEKGGAAPKSAAKSDVVADAGDANIRKTGENSYEVGQGEVDKALTNISDLATSVRAVPAFEGGKTVGFKLFSIRPGSLVSKIGLQNGDIITRINGYEINSPEKGLEIYGKLKDAKQVTVDVKRRGKPTTLDYNITP